MSVILSDVLHKIGQILLNPCLIVLVLFIIATIWQCGMLIVEFFCEHRKQKEDIPTLLHYIHKKGKPELREIIKESKLLKHQQAAIMEILDNQDMPKESILALARTLLMKEESRYEKATRVTDYIIKLGPMFGLLGTLIPLGPGIVALGQGDTVALSMAMATAFDTTIAGVITGATCFVLSKIRKRWYNDYLASTETIMECIIQEVLEND